MINNLIEIQNLLKNKKICLLGNSNSILTNPKNIDSYDIICRINRGNPSRKERFIGSRTDVLFLATRMEENDIKKFNSKCVIWTTKDTKLQSNWVKQNSIQNPPEDWQELSDNLTTLPSTGCVAIYFLIKYIDFLYLDIYGFDFFKSGTWYHSLKQKWHNEKVEEIFITNLIKNNSKIQLILE
jgi:hypothetical protein